MGVIRLMKYAVGDKVRIKKDKYINSVQKLLEDKDWVFKIVEADENTIIGDCYIMKEDGDYWWSDDMIEYKIEKEVYTPIKSRWELLDL